MSVCVCVCVYIYIYIFVLVGRSRVFGLQGMGLSLNCLRFHSFNVGSDVSVFPASLHFLGRDHSVLQVARADGRGDSVQNYPTTYIKIDQTEIRLEAGPRPKGSKHANGTYFGA